MARPEFDLQCAAAVHLKVILAPDIFWTARDLSTPSAREGQNKKAMGCKAGLFDLEFWLTDQRRRLHVEAKVAKTRKSALTELTDSQKRMIPIIEAHGEVWDVFWTIQELECVLTRHGIQWQPSRFNMSAEQRDIKLAARAAAPSKVSGRGFRHTNKPTAARIKRVMASAYGVEI